jgi:hypothetical protein
MKAAALFFLIPLVGIFVAEYFNLAWLLPILGLIALIGIPVLVLGIILFVRNNLKDLNDEYRTYLKPLLMLLQDDLKPGSPIAVSFHLSPLKQKAFSQGKGPKYSKGAYPECYDHPFQRVLLALKLRLQDGNRLMISLNELTIETARTKKSASGKYKTKYKYRKRLTTDFKVLVNPEKFSCKSLPAEGEQSFYIKERNGIPIIGLRTRQNAKALNADQMPLEHTGTLEQIIALYTFVESKTAAPGNAPE